MSALFCCLTLHVPNVWQTCQWYQLVFGLLPRYAAPDGSYAELHTGDKTLAFASEALERRTFPVFRTNSFLEEPPGLHLSFLALDIEETFARALRHGAVEVARPGFRPWGRIEAAFRDPNGLLINLVSNPETGPKQLGPAA